ncbi:hypothetical protein TPChic_0820a [Treponema pallidum subsp. pallidum str. Chicago]|nr:hypothetical protein TPChic_0820a [Treponema pallidum subsp. pallidum str. Chicago]
MGVSFERRCPVCASRFIKGVRSVREPSMCLKEALCLHEHGQ